MKPKRNVKLVEEFRYRFTDKEWARMNTKDGLRKEVEKGAGYRFTDQEWAVLKTVSLVNLVRMARILGKAWEAGFKSGQCPMAKDSKEGS